MLKRFLLWSMERKAIPQLPHGASASFCLQFNYHVPFPKLEESATIYEAHGQTVLTYEASSSGIITKVLSAHQRDDLVNWIDRVVDRIGRRVMKTYAARDPLTMSIFVRGLPRNRDFRFYSTGIQESTEYRSLVGEVRKKLQDLMTGNIEPKRSCNDGGTVIGWV